MTRKPATFPLSGDGQEARSEAEHGNIQLELHRIPLTYISYVFMKSHFSLLLENKFNIIDSDQIKCLTLQQAISKNNPWL